MVLTARYVVTHSLTLYQSGSISWAEDILLSFSQCSGSGFMIPDLDKAFAAEYQSGSSSGSGSRVLMTKTKKKLTEKFIFLNQKLLLLYNQDVQATGAVFIAQMITSKTSKHEVS
jgi:hypothetical protein